MSIQPVQTTKQRLITRRRVLGLLGLFGVGAYAFLDATQVNLSHVARSVRPRSVDGPPPPIGHKLDHIEPIIPSADSPQVQQLLPEIDQSVEECPYETADLQNDVPIDPTFIPTDDQLNEHLSQFDFQSSTGGCWTPKDCRPRQRVAIVIPYKNRAEHLQALLYRLHPMLHRQKTAYCIFVAEQEDDGRFNKGAVMNAGFLEVNKMNQFDCVVFHDVDMLPESDYNIYQCQDSPTHLSPLIDKFDYKPYGTDFGGITMLRPSDYIKANGMSNLFWGWGREDDDMQHRIELASLEVAKPLNYDQARYKMIPHQHPWIFRNFKLRDSTTDVRYLPPEFLVKYKERTPVEGVNSVEYQLARTVSMPYYTKLYIELRRLVVNDVKTVMINSGKDIEIGSVGGSESDNSCSYVKLENAKICEDYGHTMVLKSLRKKSLAYKDAVVECDKLGYMCVGFAQDDTGRFRLREVTQFMSGDMVDEKSCNTRGNIVFHKQCPGDTSFVNLMNDILLPTYPNDQNVPFQHQVELTNLVPARGRVVFRQALLVEGVQIGPIYSRVFDQVESEMKIDFSLPTPMPGFYTLVSKLTDELGQPLYEWKSTMRVTTGDNQKDIQVRREQDINKVFESYGWGIQNYDDFKKTFNRLYFDQSSPNQM